MHFVVVVRYGATCFFIVDLWRLKAQASNDNAISIANVIIAFRQLSVSFLFTIPICYGNIL